MYAAYAAPARVSEDAGTCVAAHKAHLSQEAGGVFAVPSVSSRASAVEMHQEEADQTFGFVRVFIPRRVCSREELSGSDATWQQL